MGDVQIPDNSDLEAYAGELRAEFDVRWPNYLELPTRMELEGLTVRDRQLYTFYIFTSHTGFGFPSPETGLSLTTLSGLGSEHEGAAFLVSEWFGYDLDRTEESERRTTYFLRRTRQANESYYEPLWIANWALEQFPDCLLFGDEWTVPDAHSEGGGGAI